MQHEGQYIGWYVPCVMRGRGSVAVEPSNVSKDVAFELIEGKFVRGNRIWIHNAKFDLRVYATSLMLGG